MRDKLVALAEEQLGLPIDLKFIDAKDSKNAIPLKTILPWGWYNPANVDSDQRHEVEVVVSHEGEDYDEEDIIIALAHELGHCVQYEKVYQSLYHVYNMANIFTHGHHENMAWDYGSSMFYKLDSGLNKKFMDTWLTYAEDWRNPLKQANFILGSLEYLGIAEINRKNIARAFRLTRNEEKIETT